MKAYHRRDYGWTSSFASNSSRSSIVARIDAGIIWQIDIESDINAINSGVSEGKFLNHRTSLDKDPGLRKVERSCASKLLSSQAGAVVTTPLRSAAEC